MRSSGIPNRWVEGIVVLLTLASIGWVLVQYTRTHWDRAFAIPNPKRLASGLITERRWEAVMLPHNGTATSTGVEGRYTPDGAFLLFGPYVAAAAGTYELTLDAVPRTPSGERILHVQLASAKGTVVHATTDVYDHALPHRATVILPAVPDLEIRVAVTSETPIEVRSITLTRTHLDLQQTLRRAVRGVCGYALPRLERCRAD